MRTLFTFPDSVYVDCDVTTLGNRGIWKLSKTFIDIFIRDEGDSKLIPIIGSVFNCGFPHTLINKDNFH